MAGLAGAYLSVAYTPLWVENMTAGKGWIALALVVFATWRPLRVLLGAWLFGGMTILQLQGQALGLAVPSELLSALPYLATIIVLVIISQNRQMLGAAFPGFAGQAIPSRNLERFLAAIRPADFGAGVVNVIGNHGDRPLCLSTAAEGR